MSDTIYCYHCSRSHPREEMRHIHTRTGARWRCIKSIQATKRSVAERDAFGKKVTAINSEKQSVKAKTAAQGAASLPSR